MAASCLYAVESQYSRVPKFRIRTSECVFEVRMRHNGATKAVPMSIVQTIDIILDRRPIDRYCLLALTSGGAAILNRSPAPFTVMCLAGAMSCQRI